MSFPPATEMFQFAGFASRTYEFSTGYPLGWVAPFGDPGINDRSHLPRAFRSVPRPSSPLSAKASTRCPSHASRATPNGKHRRRNASVSPQASGDTTWFRRKPSMPRACPGAHRGPALGAARATPVAVGGTVVPPVAFLSIQKTLRDGTRRPERPHEGFPGRRFRRGHNSLLHICPSATPRPASRSGGAILIICRDVSGASARFRRNGVSPVAHQSCCKTGGGERARTVDLRLAKPALSQLSYTPVPGTRSQGSGARIGVRLAPDP